MDEKNNKIITKKEKYNNLKSSIFFPNQIKVILLHNVATPYIVPNSPCVMFNSALISELNRPIKKLWPMLEKKVKTKPKIIILKLVLTISIIII